MKPRPILCVMCKGTRNLCGLHFCPILTKLNTKYSLSFKLSANISGPSNEVFVGSYGYPSLAIGPLVGIDERPLHPSQLYLKCYDEIISHRMRFVRGKQFLSVTERVRNEIQEVALSIKPVESEMELTKSPSLSAPFSSDLQPMGPSAPLKKFRQAENPKIPKKVDTILEENLPAVEAIRELTNAGFDNYYLTNIFATGALGKEENKKIVPTRWSITAIHDIVAKHYLDEIREFEQINEIRIFHHASLGNSYSVILLPGVWEFENFESWSPRSIWAQDATASLTTVEYESFGGTTKYAEKQGGGYYASRFSVVEYLHRIKKQAKAIVIREIDETYVVPLGVFQVQEGVKNALNSSPQVFNAVRDAFDHLSLHLRVPLKKYLSLSNILNQSRLRDFV